MKKTLKEALGGPGGAGGGSVGKGGGGAAVLKLSPTQVNWLRELLEDVDRGDHENARNADAILAQLP